MRWLVVLLALGVMGTGTANAQLDNGRPLLTLNLAPVGLDAKETDSFFWGGGFTANLEKISNSGKLAFGFAFGYMAADEGFRFGADDSTATAYLEAVPLMLTTRYFLGSRQTPFYIGLGVGVHFSNLEVRSTDGQQAKKFDSKTGLAFAIPLGINIYLDRSLFLNVNYQPTYFAEGFLDSDIAHVINFGFGIQFPE